MRNQRISLLVLDPLTPHPLVPLAGSDGGRQIRKAHGISDRMWELFRPLAYKDAWGVVPMLLRPKSRGSVRLRDAGGEGFPGAEVHWRAV